MRLGRLSADWSGDSHWGFARGECGCYILDVGWLWFQYNHLDCKCQLCKNYDCECECELCNKTHPECDCERFE